MTNTEQRILDAVGKMGAVSPTRIGLALGYQENRASSRVAPTLKALVDAGKLVRSQQGRVVWYSLKKGEDGANP